MDDGRELKLGDLCVFGSSTVKRREPEQDHTKIESWKNFDPLLGQAFQRTDPLDLPANVPLPRKNSAYCTRDNTFAVRTRLEISVLIADQPYRIIKRFRNQRLEVSTDRTQRQSVRVMTVCESYPTKPTPPGSTAVDRGVGELL